MQEFLMTLPLSAGGQEFASKQCNKHFTQQWTPRSAVRYEKCAILPTCKLHCTESIALLIGEFVSASRQWQCH
jgi:hypothetical protein